MLVFLCYNAVISPTLHMCQSIDLYSLTIKATDTIDPRLNFIVVMQFLHTLFNTSHGKVYDYRNDILKKKLC